MGCMMAGVTLFSASCTDYLDKSADSDVSPEAAYQNFTNFQGFVEEIYNCIPDKANCNWTVSFNWGEDEMITTNVNYFVGPQLDLGNFWAWQTAGANYFYQGGNNSTSTDRMSHSIWGHAWYCIRKANMGIANIDKMVNATQEQRDLILGQLYFFRAWWHFECMMYLGRLPYIDTVLDGANVPRLPRLTYQECADKCAADFRRAADLLPIDWDDTSTGQSTSGHNDRRINRIMALGYLGKVYLWSASPLMKHGAMTGAGDLTYDYDTGRPWVTRIAAIAVSSTPRIRVSIFLVVRRPYSMVVSVASRRQPFGDLVRLGVPSTCAKVMFVTVQRLIISIMLMVWPMVCLLMIQIQVSTPPILSRIVTPVSIMT